MARFKELSWSAVCSTGYVPVNRCDITSLQLCTILLVSDSPTPILKEDFDEFRTTAFGMVDVCLMFNRRMANPNDLMFGIADNNRWPIYGFSDSRDAVLFKMKFHV